MTSCSDVALPDATKTSTPATCSSPSTKPPGDGQRGTALLDDRAFVASFTPIVALDVQRRGLANADFRPTLEELLTELETNPYQFPLKRYGKLDGARRGHHLSW
jgi:hypothetical protein